MGLRLNQLSSNFNFHGARFFRVRTVSIETPEWLAVSFWCLAALPSVYLCSENAEVFDLAGGTHPLLCRSYFERPFSRSSGRS
jgi:hypothetical protein